jgi:hypothetical protein
MRYNGSALNGAVMGKAIEAIIGSPPERDGLVVQLFVKDGGQWGEVFEERGKYLIELYPRSDGQPWRLDCDELRTVLEASVRELASRLDPTSKG